MHAEDKFGPRLLSSASPQLKGESRVSWSPDGQQDAAKDAWPSKSSSFLGDEHIDHLMDAFERTARDLHPESLPFPNIVVVVSLKLCLHIDIHIVKKVRQ
jgi:hypothetical protein